MPLWRKLRRTQGTRVEARKHGRDKDCCVQVQHGGVDRETEEQGLEKERRRQDVGQSLSPFNAFNIQLFCTDDKLFFKFMSVIMIVEKSQHGI